MAETTPPVPAAQANMGQPIARYEARGKVTGQPLYADDLPLPGSPAVALFVTSGVAKGRIAAIDTSEAEALAGVVKIYTYRNAPKRQPQKHFAQGGYVSDSDMPLAGPDIVSDGQIIAVVVAEDLATARDAGHHIAVRYAAQAPSATFGSPGVGKAHPPSLSSSEKKAGNFDRAFAAAPVTIDQRYSTPTMHHNPMELFSTAAAWDGDRLTLHEPSQFVWQLKNGTAEMLQVDPDLVEVRDPFVGGAFGSKGIMSQRTALIAGIARDLGRPIKNVVMRDQGFTLATYRAETQHRVRLGATRDGKLTALSHEGWEVTSRQDDYSVAGTSTTTEMYACPNIASRVELVKADRNTPGFMRSPPETPYMYALEAAMDEMAVALGMDPVEFRRINDTMKSPVNGAPYTSRSLMKCYDEAAKAFGWNARRAEPGTTQLGDWLVGYGCATACYPTAMMPSAARALLGSNGRLEVQIAAHDVGTGAYTVMQQIAARELGIDPKMVTVKMGDTAYPPGPVAGGSMTTASAGSAVKLVCDKLKQRFGGAMPAARDLPDAFARIGSNRIEEYAEWAPPGSGPDAVKALYKGKMSGGEGGDEGEPKPLMYAFGAEFAEVRIHRLTREIRVPRMVGAFAGGHIVNPRTARSQYLGGMIWGLGQALLEQTELDRLRARYINDNIAEYLVAVNADVPEVDIIMVPEVDEQVNPLGVKGIGELANVGTAAAIANAVYNATGKRIRDLPVTMDKLLLA
ncbi:xanthine dehydrogenase [Altererythrobacter sp. B11]|uniref:xanthine dehydrogenase family protein molybdopterin-binding subunit n=1 Tax=Altererythrobacter sp. B11 TaxID=2060312 RepID=UPI000DC71732|nr:xanthine dehydrogenase family protein molybdopterin-binding subunit [Altererythrobacter sp. B11]BBC72587.1 xanthine dehydrogenase [Altererythrobacter sp. B11]